MRPDPALDSRASWLRLAVALVVGLVGNVGVWVVILVLPAVEAEFGIDRAAASLPYTVTMVGFTAPNTSSWTARSYAARPSIGR